MMTSSLVKSIILCFLIAASSTSKLSENCRFHTTAENYLSKHCCEVRCWSFDEILKLKNISLIEKLEFFGQDNNLSLSLHQLKNLTNVREIYFNNIDEMILDWRWFSDSVSLIGFYKVNTIKIVESDDCLTFSSIKTVRIYDANTLPKCFPNSVKVITIDDFYNKPDKGGQMNYKINVQKWSFSLTNLDINYFSLTNITDQIFPNIPNSVEHLKFSNARFHLDYFHLSLPTKLLTFIIEICKLRSLADNSLILASRLRILNLDVNLLTKLPSKLPLTLRNLSFPFNRIKSLENTNLFQLKRLLHLNASSNYLKDLPSELPSNLVSLDLSFNQITFLPKNSFTSLRFLEKLRLGNNRLFNMPCAIASTIKTIELNHNYITKIDGKENYEFCSSCAINLSNNPIIFDDKMWDLITWMKNKTNVLKIDHYETDFNRYSAEEKKKARDAISEFEQIGCKFEYFILECKYVNLTSFPSNVLPFRKVSIYGNPNLGNLPKNFYKNQYRLKTLILLEVGMTSFPIGLPISLTYLKLVGNKLSKIGDEVLKLTNLKILNLSDNKIVHFRFETFFQMTNLRLLKILDNPVHCGCQMYNFVTWFTVKYSKYRFLPTMIYPSCATPQENNGLLISQLSGFFWYRCFSSCNLSRKKLEDFKMMMLSSEVDCSKNTNLGWNLFGVIQSLKILFSSVSLGSLLLKDSGIKNENLNSLNLNFIRINLKENFLIEIPFQQLDTSVQEINLEKNLIKYLPNIKHFEQFKMLKVLNLNLNKIRLIGLQQIRIFDLVQNFSVLGNPLSCDCHQMYLINKAQNTKSNERLNYQFEKLKCSSPKKFKGQRLINITSDYCLYKDENNKKKIVVAVLAATSFLILLFLLFFILMKKINAKHELELVTGFKKLLEEEKQTTRRQIRKKYDAFVSYVESNSDFVLELVEELEKRGRKICFSERDFIAGKGIYENFVDCISQSNRFIFIISNDYIQSCWCQYQIKVALSEMNELKKGQFLISIKIEDIRKCDQINPTLNELNSLIPPNTEDFQGWEDFWDNLEELLPKKPSEIIN